MIYAGGGGLHLASSEARRRDGLLRRNLHYILTAIVAVVASVALAVPSVYADPANNAAEESAQTTVAASDVESLADGGDNSWQIVECASKNEDGCTTTSADGNVLVHKWVTPTATENVFDVHLSIDKQPDLINEIVNANVLFENNRSEGQIGDSSLVNGNLVHEGEKATFTYVIQIYDESNQLIEQTDPVTVRVDKKVQSVFMGPGLQYGQRGYLAWQMGAGYGSGEQTSNPAKLQVKMSTGGFDEIFGEKNTTVSLKRVSDVMGVNIAYKDSLKGDINEIGTSWNEDSSTLTWVPNEKQNVEVGDDGWLNDVAEISYRVELVNFQSSGLVKDNPKPAHPYDTNSSATLSYEVSTTMNGEPSGQPTSGSVNFTTPVVRGLLYDLVAEKTDGTSALPGATFGLYDAEETKFKETLSDNNGRIVFTDLPWGTYTVKEITPPEGYQLNTTDSWTVTVCYTTNPDPLKPSSATGQSMNAMVEREDSFVNKPATVPATIKVAKRISGRDGKTDDTFTFVLTPNDGAPMPAGDDGNPLVPLKATIDMGGVKDGATEETSFAKIPVPIPSDGNQVYTYTLTESGDDAVKGLVYSKAKYTVTVTVDADGKVSVGYTPVWDDQGESVQDSASSADVPVFTNSLEHRLVYQPLVKTLEGRQWGEGDSFTFLVKPEGGKPSGNDPTVVNGEWSDDLGGWLVTVTYNDIPPWFSQDPEHPELPPERMAEIVFDVPYQEETLYKYVVTEVTPAEPEAGMLYSKAQWSFILVANRSNGFHTGDWVQELGDDGTSLNGQGQQPNALVMDISFVNRMAAVSDLPLTGGRSTARTLLLAGGGVLLVAGAAWLLARRRRV